MISHLPYPFPYENNEVDHSFSRFSGFQSTVIWFFTNVFMMKIFFPGRVEMEHFSEKGWVFWFESPCVLGTKQK